jgi:hypothetical protein
LRLDAHQYFTPEHLPEHLASILQRNKFAGSIAVAHGEGETRRLLEVAERHEFIRGVVGCGRMEHPKFVGELRNEVMDAVEAVRLAQERPAARIAILRLGAPPVGRAGGDEWATAMECAAQYPQIFCKACGLLLLVPKPWKAEALRPYMQHALRVFGPRRVMFGSEWPLSLPEAIWKESLAIFTQAIGAQAMEAREEMLGGTAARFYGITG